MMAQTPRPTGSTGQHRKRFHAACNACREKRVRCDGEDTCARCSKRNLTCDYAQRAWSSKGNVRETIDWYCEMLRRRECVLDAVVSNPGSGDELLRHLREHGAEKTYEKLEDFEEYTWEDSNLMGSSQGGIGEEMSGQDDAGAIAPQRTCAAWENGSQTFWPSFRDVQMTTFGWPPCGSQDNVGSSSGSMLPDLVTPAQPLMLATCGSAFPRRLDGGWPDEAWFPEGAAMGLGLNDVDSLTG